MMKRKLNSKALAALAMSAVMAASPVVTACASEGRLLGDANADGTIDIADATAIQRHIAQFITFDKLSMAAADTDGDGAITITDVTALQKWVAQIEVPYAIGEPVEYSEPVEPLKDYSTAKNAAVQVLAERLEAYRRDLYVYQDYNNAENHYTQRARMGNTNTAINELWQEDPHSGQSCIRCSQTIAAGGWNGWLFLNGYQKYGCEPQLNRGDEPGQGLDLSGARELRFWARGEEGGETVEFYTGGFLGTYGDSTGKVSLGEVTLAPEWREYIIPLEGVDMRYICNGFAYVTNDRMNNYRSGEMVFYLDDIRFTGEIAYAKNMPVLLRSYDTDKVELGSTAFTYDNTLVAMAFLSEGMYDEARQILDALRYAVNDDRSQNGRIRNAYRAGVISPDPGWECGARMPGWIDHNGEWAEDAYQVGSNVGNTSFTALAMLQYDKVCGTDRYLATAETLMNWVLAECSRDGNGFIGGYDGWPEKGEEHVLRFTYLSTEHNIDALAAFRQLYAVTGKEKFREAADSALAFLRSMYNEKDGWFYTGTTPDGVTPNTDVVVLDTQVWSAMVLGEEYEPYVSALDLVGQMKTAEGGYPFCVENKNGGWWCEGTAFTALMYALRGDNATANEAMDALCSVQLSNGLLPAATVENLSTGILLTDGSPWEYGNVGHIAPTAWFVMAVNGLNPYTF